MDNARNEKRVKEKGRLEERKRKREKGEQDMDQDMRNA